MYIGDFYEGEMDGTGIFTSHTGEQYTGQYSLNVREGEGTLLTTESQTITGTFRNNKPHGEKMQILYPNEDEYIGSMIEGEINGKGKLV
jgi:hypothetical protein